MIPIQVLSAVALFIVSVASGGSAAQLPFHPRDYPKKVASCPAVNRAQNAQVDIDLRTGPFSIAGN
jgi:hypothetical protein